MADIFSQELYGVEFDPLYGEIESTLTQMDESSDPLSGPDNTAQINWNQLSEQAGKLLEQCYDLRVALWAIRANLHQDGISSLYHGIVELSQLVLNRSDAIYPKSEEGNINGGHAAALGWLSTPQFIAELKSAKLTKEHGVRLSDLINVDAAISSERTFSSSSATLLVINTYYQKNGLPDIKEQISAINQAIENVENYANQYTEGYQLDCRPLRSFLTKVLSQINQLSVVADIDDEHIIDAEVKSSDLSEDSLLDSREINVRSRQEIILMLDRILDYFQRHEPSHPAPIFIRRSKQMIGMDFVSIVEDLLPESMSTLQQYTGK
ncbi:type VI secretion system protein TssA [Enterobacillus tribolii]|uniref:Type VI secretion system protein ImpA n=1 Tax=Enterobacillus tribolii TaxID=1487935 RepID=A0A370QEM9_9GAMM|nr:type VI secretion system ImpA family N-terminal domain-containing protein [Enterobacillus tribolii]MBW7984137.1 hypothetical protein [Enterobacillus tribolii]RDK86801.1 type VI secretion system protein ImpA [Enterobacillus tribolii]